MSSNSSFANCAEKTALDPTKHVNFVHGMVLGVHDFQQEFAWHAGRHAALARELAGYGTVSGLHVGVDDNSSAQPKIAVEPGVAVTPTGEFARVTARQCASLSEWLARQPSGLKGQRVFVDSPERQVVRVYVRLRYLDCLADPVPIPGEPCRTEEEAMSPSRVADSWRLHLSFDPPPQPEEDAVRELVHWLKQVKLVQHSAATPAEVADALRTAAVAVLESKDLPEALVLADPPESLLISREDLCECLRAALLVWVTELRPRVRAKLDLAPCCGQTAHSFPREAEPPDDVLLGELVVPLRDAAGGEVEFDPTVPIVLEQRQRPYLLNTRMLQELVTCGPDAIGELTSLTFGSLQAVSEDLLLLWLHHPQALELSAPGAVELAVNDSAAPDFSLVGVSGSPNLFELRLGGSTPTLLGEGDRVSLGFDATRITESTSGETLFDELETWTRGYLDRQGDRIFVRCIVGKLKLDDLTDVDAAEASDDLVLTSRAGRWVPAAVPRRLDDLSDVDIDGLSVSNGQVLTHEDGRWQPRDVLLPAHEHALSELSDVSLSAPDNAEVLTFRDEKWVNEPVPRNLTDLGDVDTSGADEGDTLILEDGVWKPGRPDTEAPPLTAVSGLITFEPFKRGQVLLFGPFSHGIRKVPVMVRLAFEFPADPPVQLAEDTASLSFASFPRLVVYVYDGIDRFLVLVDDEKGQGDTLNFAVRWFAVPATDTGTVPAETFNADAGFRSAEGRALLRGMVLAEVAGGATTRAALERRIGANRDLLQAFLKQMVTDRLISIDGDRITLVR